MLKKMQTIKINGNKFSNLSGFYNEVERKMTRGLSWKIGRNLDAFEEVLSGGFGVIESDEVYTLVWLKSQKSKTELKEYETIIEIITDNSNIKLELK